MARTKTVHAQMDTPEMKYVNFSGAKIAEFGRMDPESGWIKFKCSLGTGMEELFAFMKWQVPGDRTALERLDGKLNGGHFVLTGKGDEQLAVKSPNGAVDTTAEVDIEYAEVHGFECHRLEKEGRKKKGFRRELRFSVKFKCEDGCANLESYMKRTGNASGALKVWYIPEPEQGVIGQPEPTAEQTQMKIDDIRNRIAAPSEAEPTSEVTN